MYFKKATKFGKIFTIDLMLYSKYQIDGKITSIFVAFLENMNFMYVRVIKVWVQIVQFMKTLGMHMT